MKLFTETRVRVYARLIAFTLALLYIVLMWMSYRSFQATGAPVPAHDFLVFYGAGLTAQAGDPAQVYNVEALLGAIRERFSLVKGTSGWFYPPYSIPPFQLLSELPYFTAYLTWIGVTGVFFFMSLRPLIHSRAEFWAIAASPAIWWNIVSGQNAFLVCGLLAIFYRSFRDSQVRAGLVLGLMAIKPHLGLLIPVFLLLYRRFQALLIAVLTFLVLVAVSLYFYGLGPWGAFFGDNLEGLQGYLASGELSWSQMASPYITSLSFGLTDWLARFIQFTFCALTLLLVVSFVRGNVPFPMVFAFAIVAAVPFSPHNFLYDWVLFALPVLILLRTFTAAALRPLEWTVIGAVYLAPIGLLMIPQEAKVSPGFLPVAALYLVFALRCHQLAGQNTRTG